VLADAAGDRPVGVHVQVAEGQRRHRGEGVDLRAQRAQLRSRPAPASWSHSMAASTATSCRPRNAAGISAMGGTCSSRPIEVTSSGTDGSHSRHACRTSRARSHGHASQPAYSSGTG
jgi:hypothetical protein